MGAPSSWDFTGFRQGLKDMGYLEGQNLASALDLTELQKIIAAR
jgi:hypothetical protein